MATIILRHFHELDSDKRSCLTYVTWLEHGNLNVTLISALVDSRFDPDAQGSIRVMNKDKMTE